MHHQVLGNPVAIYPYTRISGDVAFVVCRFDPKDFRPAQPRNGKWVWNLQGAPTLLYRLPDVERALASGDTIWITDGEKDADALTYHGATATCCARAQSWTLDHSEQLTGARHIKIVADRDGGTGVKQASEIASSLVESGAIASCDIDIVQAAVGKDATDHLDALHTLDEFEFLDPMDVSSSPPSESPIVIETWASFERTATAHVPTIIDGLWPEGAFGFVAAPPKKGKTWVGLSIAISVAAGLPVFNHFSVQHPLPVIYLALEGHKAAIRGRIGCLARGMGINPDHGHDLDNLHIIYKPRDINLADPVWAGKLQTAIEEIKPALIVVDVLRAAAAIKENSNDDFRDLRRTLQPISDAGIAIALLHHFGKLTEITKERSAGERMSGGGAMYGAMDAGIFITGADEGARRLRLEFELRDLATPDHLGVYLSGDTTGINGGFVYHDTATWQIDEAPNEDDLTGNAVSTIEWLEQQPGRQATTAELLFGLEISNSTMLRRRPSWQAAGVIWTPGKGNNPSLYSLPDDDVSVSSPITSRPPRHTTVATQETLEMQGESENPISSRHASSNDSDDMGKSAHLQDKPHSVYHVSPTESDAPADATPLTDYQDELAKTVDLEIPLDPPEQEKADGDIPF